MTYSYKYEKDLEQERFGLQVAAQLSEAAADLPYDVSERLRAARMQALGKRKLVVTKTATQLAMSGTSATLTFGGDHANWWHRIASIVPLIALVFGLVAISIIQDEDHTNELAEIDSALLTDDLPPAAYTDPGFAHFLKLHAAQNQ